MVAALFVAFFLGGAGHANAVFSYSSLERASERIELAVGDPPRQASALAAVRELQDLLGSFDDSYADTQNGVTDAFKDHSAGAAEMSAQLNVLERDWLAAQQAALDMRFAMKDALTPEEWNAVFGN